MLRKVREGFAQGAVLRGATIALWSKHESQEIFFTEMANIGKNWNTVGMLGLQALHVKVSKAAVPQYMVALGSKGNTRTRVTRFRRGGA
jgi:hypothetical protein